MPVSYGNVSFKPVMLCDKCWVDPIVMAENSPSADYNFGNIYIWDTYYKQLICRFEDRMFTELCYEDEPFFAFPIGSGPLRPAIDAWRDYCLEQGYPMILRCLTEAQCAQLEETFPRCFSFEREDDSLSDYIYPAEQLATFAGKAMHGKKNHCNRFEAENDWDFLPLTWELIPGCLDMLDLWMEKNTGRLDSSIVYERDAILRAFAVFEYLGLEGGVLRSSGRIVGFSLGELSCADTFNVHFKKAETGINGAYPMVCRELTRQVLASHPGLRWINREDDMGIEALRASKLSYKPEFLLHKYSARGVD